METIVLTREQRQFSWDLAKERRQLALDNGVANERMGSQNDVDIMAWGTMAEVAVATLLAGSPDDSLDWGDPPDVVLPNGDTVEVKATTKRGYDFGLETDNPEDLGETYGVLVWPSETANALDVIGWTTVEHMREHGQHIDRGHGTHIWMSPEDLRPMQDLVSRLFFEYDIADAQRLFREDELFKGRNERQPSEHPLSPHREPTSP